jgi:putative aldouronate transport system permease protein
MKTKTAKASASKAGALTKTRFSERLRRDFSRNYELYILAIPIVLYYLYFCYKPMTGVYMAFTEYTAKGGVYGSPFVGLKNFEEFFGSMYFGRLLKNTFIISGTSIIFGFPAPIILALLMNEIRNKHFCKTVQTISYLPHFISMVVVCSMIKTFVSDTGVIGSFVNSFTGGDASLLNAPENFVPIYVISGIWQEVGWGSIIYFSALMGIDQQLYEAAEIDGAGRWKQTLHITIPGIAPTIIVMLILKLGSILGLGYEKIILLYNEAIYSTSDVISTFVYRKGLLEFDYSYSVAVGLFNSAVNMIFLFGSNWLSKKVQNTGLW